MLLPLLPNAWITCVACVCHHTYFRNKGLLAGGGGAGERLRLKAHTALTEVVRFPAPTLGSSRAPVPPVPDDLVLSSDPTGTHIHITHKNN